MFQKKKRKEMKNNMFKANITGYVILSDVDIKHV